MTKRKATELSESHLPKAETLDRFLARAIDLLIALAIAKILPPAGPLAAIIYILIADGIFQGQSLGKRIIRLKVIKYPSGEILNSQESYRCSFIRNLPFAITALMSITSLVGWILLPLGIILLGIETYFVITDEKGLRLGDIFGNSMVIHVPFISED